MKYIQGTIGLSNILSINKSWKIKCYVDAAFEVHKDMRIPTGGFVTTVTVGSYVHSRKKKLNTKNSTKAELVVVDDVMTQVIWT